MKINLFILSTDQVTAIVVLHDTFSFQENEEFNFLASAKSILNA
jgi:hypothetical protein